MKLGINSYSCMWSIGFQGVNPAYPDRVARPAHPLSALGLLEKARDLGIRLVQTGPNLPVDRLPEEELERFIRKAQEWGIELEHGTRGLESEHLVRQIKVAKRMGARLVRTIPDPGGAYKGNGATIPAAVRPLLPLLESERIQLAIENSSIPADDLLAVLDEIGSAQVGVVLDLANSLAIPEGWKEVTRKLAPQVMCLHYKDFTIQRAWHMMGFTCEGRPCGKGMVEPSWLFDALKASPYDFNVIIELWPPEQNTLEETIALEQAWLAESVSYLRKYIHD